MAWREYGVDNGDGTITVWRTDDAGNFEKVRTESVAQNQGQTGGAPSGGGNTYSTPNGPRTIEQMTNELRGAGYGGPWDAGSVLAAYNNTASGTGGGGSAGNGVNDLLNNVGRSNQEDYQLRRDQFDYQKLSDAQRLALEALGIATEYASNPRDYFKFNQYTSGGRNIFEQLSSSVPRAAFSAPTGPIEPGNLADVLAALGINYGGGATGGVDENAALDAIWANRPDLANFYRSNGWSVDTPEQQRAAVQNWLQMTDDPDVVAAGRNAVTYAGGKGWVNAQTTQTQQTQQATGTQGAAAQGIVEGATGAERQYTRDGKGVSEPLGTPPQTTQTTPDTTQTQYIGGSVTLSGNTYPIQLPHQVNPMVWDSLGPVGQQLYLGATGAAGWDPSEYLYQLNAARPKGTAPSSTRTYFSQPASLF